MSYALQFGDLAQYAGMFARGAAFTLGLTAASTVLGVAIGIGGAAARDARSAPLRAIASAYVEAIRNTPFIIQLFFVFFGLPALGLRLDEISASVIAMTLNLGAYATEIIRAGVAAVPRGHLEAAASLAMTPAQTYRHVVLPQALAKVFPALSSQIVIVMLGSAVVSQISVPDLTYAASYIQSRNFRAFETYLAITVAYLGLAVVVRALLNIAGRRLFLRGTR
ncbi:amino acid ABC transporter permease [Trinickia sp. EG282A]|uniref:amino acid ABC transporter permease n=1 Tax=Trinickia sp. EG282A TaxID=3237013 RepID=UPI0034D3282C